MQTTLFFTAFLPQFMSPGPAPMLQSIALGALFVVIAAITDSVYAVGAGVFAPYLRNVRRVQVVGRIVSGGAFIGLGVFATLGGTRSGK
jgi:threonine/homoserine/homoserine lactone efflux protein